MDERMVTAPMRTDEKPAAPMRGAEPVRQAVGEAQIKEWMKKLNEYKAGKASVDRRVQSAEDWWRLRNDAQEYLSGKTQAGADEFKSVSGWLHSVIVSKHADAMDSYPEPNILPREESDKPEAEMLSAIIPAVIEQNDFETTYSDVMWQKMKTGTGVYKVMWDSGKLHGLGDIAIERVNLLNLFWEPGITDIQKSEMVFHTEEQHKEAIEARYPQTKDKLKGSNFTTNKFHSEDSRATADKVTVIDVYYRKSIGGKNVLHYCKFVNEIVLYATENETQPPMVQQVVNGMAVQVPAGQSMAERGLYDHGMYPFVFDRLYPVEGSPCGYGYIDLGKNPQIEIDLMKTAIIKNAMVGATPRYFSRADGGVNEAEFLDLNKPLVHVDGNLGEDSLKPIQHNYLDSAYVTHLNNTIQELRETTGNTEAATGATPSGVTAASAIAALQEASGKGSRDSTQESYRAYKEIVTQCIELIRQFYDMPRQFRIIGEYGAAKYVSYSNSNLKMQSLNGGYRLPVFDIKVGAQKRSAYTKMAQNELAVQFFNMGFFNPQMTDQALMCLDMMDFDGKDSIMQKISQFGTMYQKLLQWQQMALMLAAQYRPDMVQGLSQSITGGMAMPTGAGDISSYERIAKGANPAEDKRMQTSRERAQQAGQPDGGRVIAQRGGA